MLDIPISIKLEETREFLWSIQIGGVEIKTLESTLKWERDMISDQLFLDFTMMKFTQRQRERTLNGLTSELVNNQDEYEKSPGLHLFKQ